MGLAEKAGAAPSFPGVAQTIGCTTVMLVAELFDETGSVLVVETVAVFVSAAPFDGVVTAIAIVAVPLGASTPRLQLRFKPPEQLPCEGVAETKVSAVGNVSVNVTPLAADKP